MSQPRVNYEYTVEAARLPVYIGSLLVVEPISVISACAYGVYTCTVQVPVRIIQIPVGYSLFTLWIRYTDGIAYLMCELVQVEVDS